MAEQNNKILENTAETKRLIQILWYHIDAGERQKLLSSLSAKHRQMIDNCTND